jgi:predicted DNA-binding transcriptional regulator YafY
VAVSTEQTQPVPSPLERIITLWLYLSEKKHATLEDIQIDLHECYGDSGNAESVRKRFERDKQLLESFGCFLVYDANAATYRIDETRSYAVSDAGLDEADESLLRVLLSAISRDETDLYDDAQMILVKLSDLLEEPDMADQITHDDTDARPIGSRKKFEKIDAACRNRKRLAFSYVSADGKKSTRSVEPHELYMIDERWYLYAYDLDRKAMRCFRIERMSKVKANEANPATPDFERHELKASDYMRLPFQLGTGPAVDARIAIEPSALSRIRSKQRQQGNIEITETGVIWTVPANDIDRLARWCIENGPGVYPLDAAAQARYAERLEQTLAALERSEDDTLR